jgi:hypothetical protein
VKIIKLVAERVKRLSAVEITPEGHIVEIAGKNAQGKTSVLDSIWYALAGTAALPSQPIKRGSKDARIELTIGGDDETYIIERTFTEKGSYLTVKMANGFKAPSPQKMLDGLLGALTFDPLDFMRRDAKVQAEILRSLVKLDVDIDLVDGLIKSAFDERTLINRDAKAKRAQADAITVAEGLPADPLNEAGLLDQIEAAANENADIERRRANREAATLKIAQDRSTALERRSLAEKSVADAKRRADEILKEAKEQSDRYLASADELESGAAQKEQQIKDAGDLPTPVDVSELKATLTAAQATNRQIAERTRKATIAAEAAKLEGKAKDLTAAIEQHQKRKVDALAKANMPVEGLSLENGAVTFGGIPLDQASDAEQLMISTAIAAALNPKLRVIRIRDGSLLDEDSFKRLGDFAKERDLQIWMEVVGAGSGPEAIVIEDGHVRGQEPKAEAAE